MDAEYFGGEIDGKEISLFHLSNNYLSCYITNYGARVVGLWVKDKESTAVDVVLGFDTLDKYLKADEQYHGATIGRYANRIENGKFSINEKEFTITKNLPPDAIHGGFSAMHNQVWSVSDFDNDSITLEHVSPHMEEGYPGELTTQLTYALKGGDLVLSYRAKSSEDTIVNLTHHSYFNLNGEGSGTVLNHNLRINAEYYTPVGASCIPTGKVNLVNGTPFDFTKKKRLGSDIEIQDEQLINGFGYDHNFVVNNYRKGKLGFVASVEGDVSGIVMEVWSSEPGVQLYTANHLSGKDVGKQGVKYSRRNAFCLETQHFPNSPNQKHFPSTLLKKGELYRSSTEYRFSLTS